MLERVVVKNFRGLVNADLRLTEPVTLILGANGAGKSSLAAAVEMGLTGACRWTDAAGRGAGVLIKSGQAQIDLAGDSLPTVSRTIGVKSSTLIVGDRDGKEAQALLDAGLPRRELLTAMLRSDGLTGLPPKEQQDLLFALAGGETDSDWFRQHLTDDEQEILADVLATLLQGSALADKLHQTAYGMRTEANRAAKDAKAKAAGEPVTPPDAAAIAKAGETLTKLRAKAAAMTEKIGGARELLRQQESVRARHEQAETELARLQEQLTQLGEQPQAPTDAEVAAAQVAADSSRSDYGIAISKMAETNAQRQALQDQADAVHASDGKCPLAAELECPLTAAQRGEILRDLQARADKLESEWSFWGGKATEAEAAGTAAAEQMQALAQRRDAAVQWQLRQRDLAAGLEAAAARRDSALAEYQQTGAPNVESVEVDLQQTQAQIAEAQATLDDLRRQDSAAKEYDLAAGVAEEAAERAAMLDALVKKLEPDGLPAQAMRETIGSVIEAINDVLARFSSFSLEAEPGKEFQLWANGTGADGQDYRLPVRCLSESEQLRVGAAIQVALAELTGFGFVIVDAADRCDGPNRVGLLQMLLQSGVQALVMATPANGTVPQAEGLAVYRLEAGVLAVAEEVAA